MSVLVIGTGGAGLRAAVELAERGVDVLAGPRGGVAGASRPPVATPVPGSSPRNAISRNRTRESPNFGDHLQEVGVAGSCVAANAEGESRQSRTPG